MKIVYLVFLMLSINNLTYADDFMKNKPVETLRVAEIFADHMVLQRNQAINVWGKAPKASVIKVTLSLSNNNKVSAKTSTDNNGHWQLNLPPQIAGGPYQLVIEDLSDVNEESTVINDVLIGDIWLASGQSNMEWKLAWQVDNWQEEVANSDLPNIRFFEITNNFSITPKANIDSSGWRVANPAVTSDFSAVAWHFAKRLHREKNIPVAIIDSTWGGTPAEAWTSLTALQAVEGYQAIASDLLNNPLPWQQKIKDNALLEKKKYALIASQNGYADGKVLAADYDDSTWQKVQLPTKESKPLSDIAWLRKTIKLDTIPQKAVLNFGELRQLAKIFINGELAYEKGWQDSPDNINIPKQLLKQGDNTLVIRLINDWDNKVYIGKTDQFSLNYDNHTIDLSGNWRYSNDIEAKLPKITRFSWVPGALFNAMIKPITPMPIKGVIWYQGESNVGQWSLYAELFQALIKDWRQQWHQTDLPFMFVQLSSFLPRQDKPVESDWAKLRAAQTDALALKNTGMAVTLDIGNAKDIHPRNKQDVGERLWLAAKHIAYGDKVVYSGPTMKTVKPIKIAGRTGFLISFVHDEGGINTKSAKNIKGFALADSLGNYVNAKAIFQKNAVFVYSEKLEAPKFVRYGWADNSDANLYNGSGLPAVPFQYQQRH